MNKLESYKQTLEQIFKNSKSKDNLVTNIVAWLQGNEEQGNLQLKIDPFKTAEKLRDLYDHAKQKEKGKKVLISWIANMAVRLEQDKGKSKPTKTTGLFG